MSVLVGSPRVLHKSLTEERRDLGRSSSPGNVSAVDREKETHFQRISNLPKSLTLRTRSVRFAGEASGDGNFESPQPAAENQVNEVRTVQDDSDFFTNPWLTRSPVRDPEPSTSDPLQSTRNDPAQDPPQTTPMASHTIEKLLVSYLSPLYVNNRTIRAEHAQSTYIPSAASPVLGNQFESIRATPEEDNGLYVGERPAVSRANQNCMENRVIMEKSLHWIDRDWKIEALPDPVKAIGSRCHIDHERDELNGLMAMSAPLLDNTDVIGRRAPKRLEMELKFFSIAFQHHYLFSLEHVCGAKLQDLFEGHHALLKEDLTGQLSDRIKGLKIHLESLKKSLEFAVTAELRTGIQSSIRDLLLARVKRDEAFRVEQLSLIELVEAWTRLKELRQKNGFTSTAYQLILQSQRSDQKLDLDTHQEAIEDELDEREILHALLWPELNAIYLKELENWQERHAEWIDAQRETDAAIRQNRSVVGAGIAHLATQPEPVRPDPPGQFKRQEELRLIEERLTQSRRRPGDSIYIPVLKDDTPITETASCPTAERGRRSDMASQRLFVRVVMNDREVCRSVAHQLRTDFTVSVGKKITVFVEFVPTSIKVEIYEESGFRNRKLAETFIPVPDATDVFDVAEESSVQFSSPEKVLPVHNAVGSGVAISSVNGAPNSAETKYTTGEIYCRAAWSKSSASKIADMSRLDSDNYAATFGPRDTRDITKLGQWIKDAKLDPNDPNYSELIHFVTNFEEASQIKYFRLEQLQQEFDFCSSEEIASNRRFQVLQLRERQVTDFVDLKMVPANPEEISPLMLTSHRNKMQQEASSVMNAGNTKREQYIRMLHKLREYISSTVYAAESSHTYEDLVNEEPILTFGKFFEVITRFWKPKQHLKPVRKRKKTVSVKQMGMIDMQLVVRIVGATYLPVRQEANKKTTNDAVGQQNTFNPLPGAAATTSHSITLKKDITQILLLRPFVVVRFGGQEKRLPVSSGPNPIWNEQLSFTIHSSAKSSTEFLKQELEIHFYDEVSVDVLQNDMLRNTHVFQRLDRHWLGSLSFSFSDLYSNSVIEGTFHLNTPPVLLGYVQPETTSQDRSTERPVPQSSLFITLDPPLTPPTPLAVLKLESVEPDDIVESVSGWMASLAKQYPERHFQPMVINTEAKSCLVTRFIRALNLPHGIVTEPSSTLEKLSRLAKYVARIPYVSDTLLFPEAVDIWTTNDQFLNLQCGDDEEHAVLLLSYFLELKIPAYLLLGNRTTGGSGAFVLTNPVGNDSGPLIWDATSGRNYAPHSVNCPLRDVGMLADASNVWANIQTDGSPRQLQWILTNSVSWKPLWSAKQSTEYTSLVSAQPELFRYEDVPFGFKQELEIQLKNTIIGKVTDDRVQYVTRWNIECDRRLYALLSTVENETKSSDDTQKEHERELRDLLRIYEIYGFPLNVSFTNTEDVTDTILATGIHKIDSNDVEFSLAVSVAVYPHSVISLWVYFVILSKRL